MLWLLKALQSDIPALRLLTYDRWLNLPQDGFLIL